MARGVRAIPAPPAPAAGGNPSPVRSAVRCVRWSVAGRSDGPHAPASRRSSTLPTGGGAALLGLACLPLRRRPPRTVCRPGRYKHEQHGSEALCELGRIRVGYRRGSVTMKHPADLSAVFVRRAPFDKQRAPLLLLILSQR